MAQLRSSGLVNFKGSGSIKSTHNAYSDLFKGYLCSVLPGLVCPRKDMIESDHNPDRKTNTCKAEQDSL